MSRALTAADAAKVAAEFRSKWPDCDPYVHGDDLTIYVDGPLNDRMADALSGYEWDAYDAEDHWCVEVYVRGVKPAQAG